MDKLLIKMMNFMRLHWFDVGLALAVVVGGLLLITQPVGLRLLLWLSLITLFLHQFEEYHTPGYFPGMMNTVMYHSNQPDRYPLNTNTALVINVLVGWLVYFLAAVLAEQALWLGIAAILVSTGNIVAHTFLFNIRGKSRYNPGMITADILLLPTVLAFFFLVLQAHSGTALDWIVGIALGIALNVIGIFKVIDWLKDEKTPYIFPARFMLPRQSKPSEGS